MLPTRLPFNTLIILKPFGTSTIVLSKSDTAFSRFVLSENVPSPNLSREPIIKTATKDGDADYSISTWYISLLLEPNLSDIIDDNDYSISILDMSAQFLETSNLEDNIGEELQENGNCESQSATWLRIEIDENKMDALGKVIGAIVNSKDELPEELLDGAKVILKVFSGVNWVKSHKEDFKRITSHASILLVVLWQSHMKFKYSSLGWPPRLRTSVKDLIKTIYCIHKVMERKFKDFANRILQGYVLRDLGKFKKYHKRLDSVAESLEENNIKINEFLLEVLDNRAQRHNEDTGPSEQPTGGSLPVKQDTQKTTVIQEITAEGSDSQRKATKAKLANQTMKYECEDDEVDQPESKALGKKKAKSKVVDDFQTHRVEEPERSILDEFAKKTATRKRLEDEIMALPEFKGSKKTKKDTRPDDEAPRSDGKKKKTGGILEDEDGNEDIQVKSPVTSKTPVKKNKPVIPMPPSKARTKPIEISEDEDKTEDMQVKSSVTSMMPLKKNKTVGPTPSSKARKKPVDRSEGEGSLSEDIQVNEPGPAKAPLKKKKPARTPKQNTRSQTAPPQSSISGFSFNNTGTGTMTNRDVGNVYNSTISDVGNDNSVNFFQPRQKPTHYSRYDG